MKNVLIISNNPLSTTDNNGKSIFSFFKSVNNINITQIYFQNKLPEKGLAKNYYRITDLDMLKSWLNCGQVGSELDDPRENKEIGRGKIKTYSHFIRILRELIWINKKWKNNLYDYVTKNKPDLIFFVGGDCCFSYEIMFYIQKLTNAKVIFFLTDDYISKKYELSPFYYLRKKIIEHKIKKTLSITEEFLTISNEMKEEYKIKFGKDSIVAANEPDLVSKNSESITLKNYIVMTYAGGLHLNRWKTLAILAKSIQEFNQTNTTKIKLQIFSTQIIKKSIKKKIELEGSSKFCGGVQSDELEKIYLNSDILVHVESFFKKDIDSTRYSFSTKIPEYLSYGKTILAIGPPNIASMNFLNDCAFCVTNIKNLNSDSLNSLVHSVIYNEYKHELNNKLKNFLSRNELVRNSIKCILSEDNK